LKKEKDDEIQRIKFVCFACKTPNEVNSKDKPFQMEIFLRTGHLTCEFCGLKLSKERNKIE
jgi:hypothetical protein